MDIKSLRIRIIQARALPAPVAAPLQLAPVACQPGIQTPMQSLNPPLNNEVGLHS